MKMTIVFPMVILASIAAAADLRPRRSRLRARFWRRRRNCEMARRCSDMTRRAGACRFGKARMK